MNGSSFAAVPTVFISRGTRVATFSVCAALRAMLTITAGTLVHGAAHALPSDLDPGFNDTGILIEDYDGGTDLSMLPVGAADGSYRLAATGQVNYPACTDPEARTKANGPVMVYHLSDGSRDTSKGSAGVVGVPAVLDEACTADEYGAQSGATEAAQAPSGQIYFLSTVQGQSAVSRLRRMNADGTPDRSFGTQGARTLTDAQDADVIGAPTRITVDGEGRVLVTLGARLARFLADGSIDTSFNGTGIAPPAPSEAFGARFFNIAVAADGGIYVFAQVSASGASVLRYTSAGALDTAFDGDGEFPLPTNNGNTPLVALSDNSVVLLRGNRLLRLSNTAGVVAEAPAAFTEVPPGASFAVLSPTGLKQLSDGRFVTVGGLTAFYPDSTFRPHLWAAMANADLTPDTTFDGDNGVRAHDIGNSPGGDETDIFVDSQGRILISTMGFSTAAGSNWTAVRLQGDGSGGVVGGPDTTPDPFDFADQTGVATGTEITSTAVPITGIDAPAPISVSAGSSYSVGCTADFATTVGSISNGQTVCVRHSSASTASTVVTTTLTVGGVTGTFTSTTASAGGSDTTPDAFTFTDQTGVAPSSPVESNVITVAGIDAAAAVSITGGQYKIGGGAYTGSAGTVMNGDTVTVRLTSGSGGQEVEAVLTIGGVSDTFTVTSSGDTQTVTAGPGTGTVVSSSQGSILNLTNTATSPAGAPAGFSYPQGFFSFDITGLPNGDTVTVSLTLPAGAAPTSYLKCNSAGTTCSSFAGALIDGRVVTLTLVDGGAGDGDGASNGSISDPGAPAVANSPSPQRSGGGGGGAMGLGLLLPLLAAAGLRRRKRDSAQPECASN